MPVSQNLGAALVGGFNAGANADQVVTQKAHLVLEQEKAIAAQQKAIFDQALESIKKQATDINKMRETMPDSERTLNAIKAFEMSSTIMSSNTVESMRNLEQNGILPQGSAAIAQQMFKSAMQGDPVGADIAISGRTKQVESFNTGLGTAQAANTPDAILAEERKNRLAKELRQTPTTQNVNQTTAPPISETEGYKATIKAATSTLEDKRKSAELAIRNLDLDRRSWDMLNQGILSGQFADIGLMFGKALAQFGLYPEANSDLERTERFIRERAQETVAILGSGDLGAGTGLSDKDVQFAKSLTGENINLQEGTLRHIVYLSELTKLAKVLSYNESIPDSYLIEQARRGDYPLTLRMPEMSDSFKAELIAKIKRGGNDVGSAEEKLFDMLLSQQK